ncbi:ABC transporter permease [Hypericibacter terrae]|uniref:ABC transporter permease n=1 Tax=Hypericibacter terrae TaxID=2602015 RepID=A0A5J6MGN1_9PROT|nr:ABC transporter permease [Hypericibacter terrae]QEX16654.1 ABC transporter permease [Hypericibacter terrae]
MTAVPLQAGAAPAGLNEAALEASQRAERNWMMAICSPSLILVGIIIFVPVGWLFWLSLFDAQGALTTGNYLRLLEQPSYFKTLMMTFKVSIIVTVVCLLLGYPLAYLLSQLPRRISGILMISVILPFWTSVLVRTYAWLVILQRRGLVNEWLQGLGIIDEPLQLAHNFTGVIVGMSHVMLPFLVLPLYASMKAIDRDYLRASLNLGASPTKTFWQVFFPLSLPGLSAGLVLTFVLCLGFFVTPALMGGGNVFMWSMRIEQTSRLYSNWGAASAMGVVLLVLTLGILWAFYKLLGTRNLLPRGLR